MPCQTRFIDKGQVFSTQRVNPACGWVQLVAEFGSRKKRGIVPDADRLEDAQSQQEHSVLNKGIHSLQELVALARSKGEDANTDDDLESAESQEQRNVLNYQEIGSLAQLLLTELNQGTHPTHHRVKRETNSTSENTTETHSTPPTSTTDKPRRNRKYDLDAQFSPPHPTLELIDNACCLFFIVELTLRLLFCPSKKTFFKNWLTWIDIISVLACVNDFTINQFFLTEKYKASAVDAVFLVRVIRIIRVFRQVTTYHLLLRTGRICLSFTMQCAHNIQQRTCARKEKRVTRVPRMQQDFLLSQSRTLSVFRLIRHNKGLQVLGNTNHQLNAAKWIQTD